MCAAVLTALALARPAAACVGDCDGDAAVRINELIRGVQIALESAEPSVCEMADNDRDGAVSIAELTRAVGRSLDGCGGGPAGEVLFSLHDNELTERDLASGHNTVGIPASHAHVNGQLCVLPGGDGRYVVGEDTGQPAVRPGWGIFAADGTFLQKLPLPARENETQVGDPIGCAVDASGRLFTTAIGSQGGADGQLIVYFPPDYAQSCILDQTLRTPGTMAIDDDGNLYVAEAAPPGRVQRIAPPFAAGPDTCATTGLNKSPFIEYTDLVASLGVARDPGGHFFVSQVIGLGEAKAGIREHAADGTFIRELFTPGSGGNPAGMAFDSAGTLYYADLGLNAQFQDVEGKGTVRRVVFDDAHQPAAPELVAAGLSFADSVAVLPAREEILTLGGSLRRTYFNPREHIITARTVEKLVAKWKYPTSGMISAQPVVTWVDLPDEGRTQLVIVSSWDHYVYALRADNGRRVWSYRRKPQPGTFYPFAGTPTVAWIDGQQRVFVPGGETMYALDATTGAELWQFDAGTGCTDCTPRQERNQIESTPAVANGLVFFGMDVNDSAPGKGGMYALRADDGRLVWFLDLMTLTTCRPFAEDDIRRFDGFHTEAELDLPDGFLASRPGCDFDRYQYACGNVWSSPALDLRRGLLYTASSNCDTDDDPETAPLPPPMRPYDEAIFALTLDGDPAWVWRPREVDNDDLSFGAVPNLFEAEIQGEVREVVGIGGKDGTYYVLDRDGVNEVSGILEPYWHTNVVPGGPIGGIIGSASVGEGQIVFESGFGTSIENPQKPAVHGLNAGDGAILWQNSDVDTGYAPTVGVPGLALVGGTPRANLNVFDRAGGTPLRSFLVAPVPSGVASASAVVSGHIFVGAGTGAFNEGSAAAREANRDTPVSAFCVAGTPGCTPNTCDDGNSCTYDYPAADGTCASQPTTDGLDCFLTSSVGGCLDGVCT
ncbi:MAG: PQQ-binding-like beta-propeller repeat protein, partial [Candidatus Binatia bacterium]